MCRQIRQLRFFDESSCLSPQFFKDQPKQMYWQEKAVQPNFTKHQTSQIEELSEPSFLNANFAP